MSIILIQKVYEKHNYRKLSIALLNSGKMSINTC